MNQLICQLNCILGPTQSIIRIAAQIHILFIFAYDYLIQFLNLELLLRLLEPQNFVADIRHVNIAFLRDRIS